MSKRRWILSLVINAYLVLSTLIITLSNLLSKRPADSSAMGFRGVENLIYYTVDSNILMSLCAVVLLILLIWKKQSFLLPSNADAIQQDLARQNLSRSLQQNSLKLDSEDTIPRWLHIVIMAAATSVGVTFATVALFLGPGQAIAGRGYFSLFTGTNLYLHLINPLLGCADFLWLIPHRRYSIPECLFGSIPTAIYGIIYTINVVFTKTWPDIYYFTFGGHYELAPISLGSILVMSFGIAVLLTRLHHRAGHLHKKSAGSGNQSLRK